jgi:hypothetical protein
LIPSPQRLLAGGYFGVGPVSESLKFVFGHAASSALDDLSTPPALNRFQNVVLFAPASPNFG